MAPTDEHDAQNAEAERRQEAALNHLLGEIGLTTSEQTKWWNLVAYPELGDRTPTQAWLAGDIEGVTALVQRWYDATEQAAQRAAGDPAFMAMLRSKLAELNERVARGGPVHSA